MRFNISIFKGVSDYLKLLKQIEQQHFEPLYVLHGEEPYFIDALSNAIEAFGLSDEDRAFNAYILYGKDTDVNQVAGFARQFPMTGNRVLVIVREAQNLKGIAKGLSDNDDETSNSKNDLLDYIKHPSPHTILVLCYKYKTIDKRTALYKLAQKNGIVFESKKLYDNQIPDWINSYVKSLHMGIHPRAAFLLSESCGSDLSRLVLEIEKIKVNLQPGQAIDIEHVEQHVGISKDYNVFELQDAIAQRHIEKALKITFVFAANEKEHPLPLLLAMLYGFFTKVMRVHFINDKSNANLAKDLGINPYFAKTYVTACGYYNLTKLKDIFKALKDCDLKSKGILPSGASHAALLQDLMIAILY
ncbi:MAG: polymerase subunit delta [Bacteroidota bacterium]